MARILLPLRLSMEKGYYLWMDDGKGVYRCEHYGLGPDDRTEQVYILRYNSCYLGGKFSIYPALIYYENDPFYWVEIRELEPIRRRMKYSNEEHQFSYQGYLNHQRYLRYLD